MVHRSRVVSYSARLLDELQDIETSFTEILDDSEIRYVNPNKPGSGVVFLGAADWGWIPSDGKLTAARMKLLGQFGEWAHRVQLLFAHPTPEVKRTLEDLQAFVLRWLERDQDDHTIPRTIDEAKRVASANFDGYRALIRLTTTSTSPVVRLVPDTSALLDNPELGSYVHDLPVGAAVMHLLPTVLRELDEIKDAARKTQDVRDRARSLQRRLKGLRDKGDLMAGVHVTKSLVLRFETREVNPSSVLHWLDPSINDDRVLASGIQIQAAHPDDSALLVTSDMNLQNKATAAGMPYIEPPPDPASLRASLKPIVTRRQSREAGSVPTVSIANDGPAPAEELVCTIQGPGATVTVGPIALGTLGPGAQSDERDLPLLGEGPVSVHATWTDGDGVRDRSWTVEVPPRPARPRQSTARMSR